MTSQQSHPAGHDPREKDLFDNRSVNTEALPPETHAASFGSRLRAAREARGLDLESCGHALKLPVRVLRQLESDQHEGIDHQIYLGSYIGKYARHLGVDEAAIQAELARIKRAGAEPALVATGGISHSRYLLERYATAATYVVLTAVIVVPVIWLGVRGTLDRDMSHLAPLDATPVVQQDAPARAGSAMPPVAVPAQRADAPAQGDGQPLMASMAPFPNLGDDAPQPPKVAAPTTAAVAAGGHSLSLDLSAASWVEVVGQDGTRLEYGLLPAGTSKTWHSDQPLDVRIGNVVGAQVSIDGQSVALDGFRHANVAHFRMQIADGKAAAASL